MNGLVESFSHAGELWWQYVLHSTWQAALLAALIIIMVKLGRRLPSPLRYWLLIVALIKFAIPPMVSIPTGIFTHAGPKMDFEQTAVPPETKSEEAIFNSIEMSYAPETPYTKENIITPDEKTSVTEPDEISKSPDESASDIVVEKKAEPTKSVEPVVPSTLAKSDDEKKALPIISHSSLGWKASLMLIHFAGIVAFAVWVIQQLLPLSRTIRNANEVKDGILYERYIELCRKMSFKRLPRFLVTSESIAPMAYGLFRPAVVIPQSQSQNADSSKFIAIITHELAHIRRRDILFNWLQIVLTALWWFNPLLWLLNREVRRVREECCDDFVLSRGESHDDDYCSTLLHTASTLAVQKNIGARLGFADRLHPLGSRIKRIMDTTLRRVPALSIWGIIIIFIVAALLLPGIGCQKKREPAKESEDAETAAEPGSHPELNEVLLKSAAEGNLAGVKSLLRRGAFINTTDVENRTPLYLGIENDHKGIAEYLLSKKANVKIHKKAGPPLINLALRKGYDDLAIQLIEFGTDIAGFGDPPLNIAIEKGFTKVSKILIEQAIDINEADSRGYEAIQAAAAVGDSKMVRLLIEKKANIVPAKGYMPLCLAENGDKDTLLAILETYKDADTRKKDLDEAIGWAASSGQINAAEFLLNEGADVNVVDQHGWTPLKFAVHAKKLEMVKFLLENGADANPPAGAFNLMPSALNNLEILKLLLEAGTNPDPTDNSSGETALQIATRAGNEEAVKLLLDAGASIGTGYKAKDLLMETFEKNYFDISKLLMDEGVTITDTYREKTFLHYAVSMGLMNAVRFLIKNGADVDAAGSSGGTPLHEAAQIGNKEIVKLLIESGANIEASDSRNGDVTPLFPAITSQKKEVVELLIAKGSNVNATNKRGGTPLQYAIGTENKTIIKLLLDAGADPNKADNEGQTPLNIAEKSKNKAIIELLNQYIKTESPK